MDDINFRAGLILLVLVLAGFFSGGLFLLTRSGEQDRMDTVSDSFGNVLGEMISQGGESSIIVSFGIDSSDSALSFPGEIGGDEYSIDVRSGMVTLDSAGGRSVVITNGGIIPSFPVINEGALNRSSYGKIGVCSGGFSIGTPCEIAVDIRESGNDVLVFIHPVMEMPEAVASCSDELTGYLNEPIEYVDGENTTVDCVFENGGLIIRKFILLETDTGSFDGSCPYPVILPVEFRFDKNRMIPVNTVVTLYRETTRDGDGFALNSGFIVG